MVHQEFRLVESFTVAENVALGDPTAAVRLRRRRSSARSPTSRRASASMSIRAARRAPLRRRAPAVEILKLLHCDCGSSSSTNRRRSSRPQEPDDLLRTLRPDGGRGAGDRDHLPQARRDPERVRPSPSCVTAGEWVRSTRPRRIARWRADDRTRVPVARAAGHRSLQRAGPQRPRPAARVRTAPRPSRRLVRELLAAARYSALAGVAGNGQRELAETIAGVRAATGGEIVMAGRASTSTTPPRS